MKSAFILAIIALFCLLHAPVSLAKEVTEERAKAKQYYAEQNFKRAYKVYFSLAKIGDHYSQSKLSKLYIAGEGVDVDLNEAYAWSVLAAESGVEGMTERSEKLLQETNDPAGAEKRAAKLMKKYSKQTLQAKAAKKEKFKQNHAMGGCTGSKLGCS